VTTTVGSASVVNELCVLVEPPALDRTIVTVYAVEGARFVMIVPLQLEGTATVPPLLPVEHETPAALPGTLKTMVAPVGLA
jgi:hypothetical protein